MINKDWKAFDQHAYVTLRQLQQLQPYMYYM